MSRGGVIHLSTEQVDDADAALAERYDRLGRIGIALVALAFLLQPVSALLDVV